MSPLIMHNEADALPDARNFVNPLWLPFDWFLNSRIVYRTLFNALAGPFLNAFSFDAVSVWGRLLTFAIAGLLLQRFARRFRAPSVFVVPLAALFIWNQSIASGEWMAGGFETKPFGYAAFFFGLLSFERRRYAAAMALFGLALSFHVLVGAYALASLALAVLALRRRFQPDLARMAWSLPLLLIFGSIGIYAAWLQAAGNPGVSAADSKKAAEIYVLFRNQHHTFPAGFPPGSLLKFVSFFGLVLAMGLSRPKREPAFFYVFALASFAPCAVGYVLHYFGQTVGLKYYWFRFTDTAVPFLCVFFGALLLMRVYRALPTPAVRRRAAQVMAVASLAIFLGSAEAGLRRIWNRLAVPAERVPGPDELAAMRWIRDRTEKNAVILNSGFHMSFYIDAERAQFVSFKHVPSSDADLLEWWRRLTFINGGEPPRTAGFAAEAEVSEGFRSLSENRIRALAERYGLHYMLASGPPRTEFRTLFRQGDWAVYDLR